MENKVFLLKIEENKEHNGFELYFDGKPSDEILDLLKANNFRWHRVKKCWYGKISDRTRQVVDQIVDGKPITASEPKATEKVLTEILGEEKEHILNGCYCGNKWVTELRTSDPKWYKNIMDSTIVLRTSDNHFLGISNESPSIKSTLWYNDELSQDEIPRNTKENFILNNLTFLSNNYLLEEQDQTFYLIKQSNGEYPLCKVSTFYSYNKNLYDNIRTLSESEKKEVLEIIEQQKAKFIKRLETYYKKYSDKICCRGYWANR